METYNPYGSAGNGEQDFANETNYVDCKDAEPFEMMPDDMNDFAVVDEAEITDDDEDSDDEDSDWMPPEKPDHDVWVCPAHKLVPPGSTEYQSQESDPRCAEDWPLAKYWPVYVSNFRVFSKHEEICVQAVHEYFACKGIPSFMVFRLKNKFYKKYLKFVGFTDMLVYFCCQKNARKAVEMCHRDLYYGYRLNVYRGRNRTFFSVDNTWFFKGKTYADKFATENTTEKYCSRFDEVTAVSKYVFQGVYVEFRTPNLPRETLQNDRFEVNFISNRIMKQRFIEPDVREQITRALKDRRFMKCRPSRQVLLSLMEGSIPDVCRKWQTAEIYLTDDPVIQKNLENIADRLRSRFNRLERLEAAKKLKRSAMAITHSQKWFQTKKPQRDMRDNAPINSRSGNKNVQQQERNRGQITNQQQQQTGNLTRKQRRRLNQDQFPTQPQRQGVNRFPTQQQRQHVDPFPNQQRRQNEAQFTNQSSRNVSEQIVPLERQRLLVDLYFESQLQQMNQLMMNQQPTSTRPSMVDGPIPEGLTNRQLRNRRRAARRNRTKPLYTRQNQPDGYSGYM
ncbi:uncharacterized protein LOC129729883 [Wyeomyia smithii]|uniref:uncharacterized protein LOC129729883 n=1 Tax=Wyeomyia smithii TaxID=174621 RepID=UPI002467F4E3|nr:uncharacterized protein LOC129729883 [Wyeomyia smithii]